MMQLVVLSCVLGAASATGLLGVAPLAPITYGAWNNNYRGPLSLAPGQPANVLGWDGRPLDTLDVNLDRSAHLTAKAYNGVHFLKKRSVVPLATPLANHLTLAHAPLVAPVGLGAAHIAPYSLSPYTSITPYARFASPLITHW